MATTGHLQGHARGSEGCGSEVDGFSESVVDLANVCSPASPSSHSEMGAMISKPRKII